MESEIAVPLQGQLPVNERLTCVGEGGCGETKDVRRFHRYKDRSYYHLCIKCKLRIGQQNYRVRAEAMGIPTGWPRNQGAAKAKAEGDRVRKLYVDLIQAGRTQAEALKEIGRQESTYREWRRLYPEFAAAVDAARSKRFKQGKDLGQENHAGFGPFRAKYFGHETYEHQQRLVQALESTKPQEITLALMYPEAGKTTTLVDWVCKVIGKNPNIRIAYISEAKELAEDVVGQVKKRMNPDDGPTAYTIDFGPFYEKGQERRGKPWAEDRFTVLAADHDEKEPTMAAAGWGKRVYGKRWDILIIDDIQAQESIGLTKKMLDYIRLTLLSRLGPEGRTVIIGTRIGHGDLYEAMMAVDLPHNVIQIPALKEDGSPTCPEMWPADRLAEKRRQVGEEHWLTAYMQEPDQDPRLRVFHEHAINDCKDHDRPLGQSLAHAPFVALGLDPALVGGNAITACALTGEKLYLLDCDKKYNLASQENILLEVQSYASRFRPRVLIVEQNAYQGALARDERLRAMAQKYGFQVIPHTTSRNKADYTFGVSAMAQSVDIGELRLPWGDDLTHHRLRPLLKEMDRWRPNTPVKLLEQDLVMSLWFVWTYWMHQRLSFTPKTQREPRPAWMTDKNWRAKQMQQNAQRRGRSYVA